MSKYLDWKYCECGCPTSDLNIAGMKFSRLMRNPGATNGNVDLHEGSHLMGKHLGNFKTFAEQDKFLRKLIKERVKAALKAVS